MSQEASPAGTAQFGMRSIFLLTAVMAIDCYLLAPVGPVPLPLLLLATFALPPMLLVGVIHGTSLQRTFSLAALLPSLTVFLFTSFALLVLAIDNARDSINYPWYRMYDELGQQYAWHLRASLAVSNLIGFVCIGVRWLLTTTART